MPPKYDSLHIANLAGLGELLTYAICYMPIADELIDLFSGRPLWMQDAARRIFSAKLSATDEADLINLCKHEAGITINDENLRPVPIRVEQIAAAEDTSLPTLVQLSAITNVNALASNLTFRFRPTGLTVFYGENGSGKSGISRILKSLCGARRRPKVHPNVFVAGPSNPSCEITYRQGQDEKVHAWSSNDGAIAALQTIPVFDSEEASVYVNAQNELTYEPRVLKCLSEVVRCCDTVKTALQAEISGLLSKMPKMPGNLVASESGRWLQELTSQTTSVAINERCRWSNDDENNLQRLQQLLAVADPSTKAKEFEQVIRQIEQLLAKLEAAKSAVDPESLQRLNKQRQDLSANEKALQEAADKIFSGSILDGVASNTWKILWDSARNYSGELAYPANQFPVVGEDSVCVLCEQPLGEKAKSRFLNLDAFVKNQLSQEIEKQKQSIATNAKRLAINVTFHDLESNILACGITNESPLFSEISTFVQSCLNRYQQSEAGLPAEQITPIHPFDFKVALEECIASKREEGHSYHEASKSQDRSIYQQQLSDLLGRKWLNENRISLSDEISRLKKISKLDEACKLTVANSITLKKNALSAQLMGDAFTARFNNMLNELGGDRLRLKVAQSGAKGKVKFGLVLRDNFQQAPLTEVLSEGEFRITSLAAFLADTALEDLNNGFIFDDPVSSLDHNFEDSVSRCLARLAQTRQVIVFTHRLTFLKALMNASNGNMTAHYLQQIDSVCGYVSGVPVHTATPGELLEEITRTNAKCRTAIQEGDAVRYGEHNKLACSYFRLAIERHIETVLLRGMIDRFSTRLKTMNVLSELLAVQETDCNFLEGLMTKYSFPEHIQADEQPFKPIPPDQIDADLASLRKWAKDFKDAVEKAKKLKKSAAG